MNRTGARMNGNDVLNTARVQSPNRSQGDCKGCAGPVGRYGGLPVLHARDFTASAQNEISSAIMAANSFGRLPIGSKPSLARRSTNFGSLTARATSLAMRSIIHRGVPAGAIKPFQVRMRKRGKPDSMNVGTWGIAARRRSAVTPSRRRAPLFTCGITTERLEKYVFT